MLCFAAMPTARLHWATLTLQHRCVLGLNDACTTFKTFYNTGFLHRLIEHWKTFALLAQRLRAHDWTSSCWPKKKKVATRESKCTVTATI